MSNKVLDTYYKNNRHIWVLVLSGAIIGTLVGLFATFFQLILDSIRPPAGILSKKGHACI
ncbi:hypothetical protein [Francisella sp. XLW-1]|uniref:hypothetical protein n=1 Tax=Francisella sp. XLW-1 TaxID=2610887 RepID=UPI00123C8AAB|nr:hypothetical protein [Francisella sp. XLW-1]